MTEQRMYKALVFLLLYLIHSNCLADEFGPVVKLKIAQGKERAECSGVVINEDDKKYYVLSCNHLFLTIKNPEYIITSVYTKDSEVVSVDIKCKLIKYDNDYDLSYFSMIKVDSVRLTPLSLSSSNLLTNSKGNAFGFPYDSVKLVSNELVIESYGEYKSQGGINLLRCKGPVKSGMSGGPLIANNEVHGILSTGADTYGTFVPAFECINFLKK